MEYKYFKANEDLYRLHIEQDDMPWNPRKDMDGNLGTMFCMHRRYDLGDETDYHDVDGLKRAIISEMDISMARIRKYAKTGKANVDLKYNRQDRKWEIWGSYSFLGLKEKYGVIEDNADIDMLDNCLIDGLRIRDLVAMTHGELIVLPLFLYDHSGITMKTSSFSDPWDSGQVGIIWTTLSKAKEICGAGDKKKKCEWIQYAAEQLENEVKMYDQYLCGDVYGYIEEKLLPDGEWEETDSCWGFYANTLDPLAEIATEVFGDNFLDEIPAIA